MTVRANGRHMETPIRLRKANLAGRGKHNARLGCVVQIQKKMSSTGKTASPKSKEEKNQKKFIKQSAHGWKSI